jgi:Bacterial PH domain
MASVSTSPDEPAAATPAPRAIFRISPLVVLVALTFAVCATPVALAAPYLWLIYLIPAGIIVWTLRVRTVADGETVAVRRMVGGRRVPWGEIRSVHLGRARNPGRARVSAVLADGSELALPAVHVRDLPRLAAVSGGRLPDPTAGGQQAS